MPIFDPDDPFNEAPKTSPFRHVSPAQARANMEKRSADLTAKEASQKRMAEHLLRNVEEGEIDNDWECEFIRSIHARVNSGLPHLTVKQDEILTRLFEKY